MCLEKWDIVLRIKITAPETNNLTNINTNVMNMTLSPKIDTDHMAMIAACLADNFLKPLNDFCNEKRYLGYVGTLAEISDWAHEFYDAYCNKLDNWDTFENSEDNKYTPTNWDDFLVAWGHGRLQQFFAQHIGRPEYFPGQINRATKAVYLPA
jgi:hypothetical protein